MSSLIYTCEEVNTSPSEYECNIDMHAFDFLLLPQYVIIFLLSLIFIFMMIFSPNPWKK